MNLISRFWNGDVSLRKTYWLFGVLCRWNMEIIK